MAFSNILLYRMKKITFLFLLSLFCYSFLPAQVIEFNFNHAPYLEPVNNLINGNISTMLVSQGSVSENVTTGDYFTDEPYISSSGSWGATDASQAKYFYFTIIANQQYLFKIDSLYFNGYATASGPNICSFIINDSIIDTTNFNAATLFIASKKIGLMQPQKSITVKIAGWNTGATSGTGDFRIDNVKAFLSTEIIPLPDSNSTITNHIQSNFVLESTTIENPGISILNFNVTDSATTDNKPTIIDSLRFWTNTLQPNITSGNIIGGALLKGAGFENGIMAALRDSFLVFDTRNLISINNGTNITDGLQLCIWLNPWCNITDSLQFLINTNWQNIFTNPESSKIRYGSISDTLTVNVQASMLNIVFPQTPVFTDTLFNISICATDSLGFVDKSVNNTVELIEKNGKIELFTTNQTNNIITNGLANINGLFFTKSDTALLQVQIPGFMPITSDTIIIGKYLFADNFETNSLKKWHNTNHWETSNINPVNGKYSLKHNIINEGGTSFISSTFSNNNFNTGTTIWRLVLNNGDFDPTSTNKFYYYLMANDTLLTDSLNYGYLVGVNFTGSTDTLSLWRVEPNGVKTIISTTLLDWNANQKIAIEIARKTPGIWTIAYDTTATFKNLAKNKPVTDKTYSMAKTHGLVFSYTNTRAGMLKADDISVFTINTPPVIISAQPLSDNTIQVVLSENLLEFNIGNINNYSLASAGDSSVLIQFVKQNPQNPSLLTITVNRLMAADYVLTISSLYDTDSLLMLPQQTTFTHTVKAKRHDIVFTEIMYDPTPVVSLPAYDYIEITNRAVNKFNLENWRLSIDGISRQLSNTFIMPGQQVIIAPAAAIELFGQYGTTISGIGTTSLTNTAKTLKLFSPENILVDSLFYNPLWITDEAKQDGGWAIERIDTANLCGQHINWAVSVDSAGGTPGKKNSIAANNIDNEKPFVTKHNIVKSNIIEITFSEPVANLSGFVPQNYIINNNIGLPDSVWLNSTPATIRLRYKNNLEADKQYILWISNITDHCNNIITDTNITVAYYINKPNDIIFNEIMADATPSVQLPEITYIELYNRSGHPVNLNKYKLKYDNYTREFPDYTMATGQYLLLCPTGNSNLLQNYGPVLDILSTTTLSATGRFLQIIDTAGQLVTSINYNKTWYNHTEKTDGGWSIERIDTENHCSGHINWQASVNPAGGTPGSQNSVNGLLTDNTPPKLLQTECPKTKTIILKFNEQLSANVLTQSNIFSFTPLNYIDTIKLTGQTYQNIEITLKNPLIADAQNTITINGLTDACGNIMPDTTAPFMYFLLQPNSIIITEIMPDPSPVIGLPEFEYIELYNRSNYNINLGRLKLGVNTTYKTLPNYELKPNNYIILCQPDTDTIFATYGNTLSIQSFVALPNSAGSITIADTAGKVINRVNYTTQWYADNDKTNGGWSLELIDTDNTCAKIYNWQASQNQNGGTPGFQNSVARPNIDTVAPYIEKAMAISSTEILLVFSEICDSLKILNTGYYKLIDIGTPINITLDPKNQQYCYLHLPKQLTESVNYKLTVTKVADYCGNAMERDTFDITYNQANLYDIVINEIMWKPTDAYGLPPVEYIELYNQGNKYLSLFKWNLIINKTIITIPPVTMHPNSFLLLAAENNSTTLAKYGQVAALPNWPDLPTSTTITLTDNQNNLVAISAYSSGWYTDELKLQGGYSLERIDPGNTNETAENWQVCNSPQGGTPGIKNSVFATNNAQNSFFIERVLTIDDKTIRLFFNKTVNPKTVLPQNFTITPDNQIAINALVLTDGFKKADLIFDKPFINNVLYQITANNNVTDVAGNILTINTLPFALPVQTTKPQIVINEVLFNPWANGYDFVELYNNSDQYYNLNNISLATRDAATSEIKSITAINPEGYLLFPRQFVVLSQNGQKIMEQYISHNNMVFHDMVSLPGYADKSGAVVLLCEQNIIDEFNYNESMHFNLLNNKEGVSLEKINYNLPSSDIYNWQSASEPVGWATPGIQNSAYRDKPDNLNSFIVEPETFSPDNDGFDDRVNFYYNFDNPGKMANITIYSAKGGIVRKLAQNILLSQQGVISWDGLNDNQQLVPVGIYVVFFEVINLDGNIQRSKKVCVLSSKF